MSRFLHHIARCSVTGFLLLAISGLTIAVHHEHHIGNSAAHRDHGQPDGVVLNTSASTYHEMHIVKFLSGDSFNGSHKIIVNSALVKLFIVQPESPQFSSVHPSTPLTSTDIKETGPPSVDRCVLLCSFLI
jgi:hypothetical protein